MIINSGTANKDYLRRHRVEGLYLQCHCKDRTINNVTVKDYQQRHRKELSTTSLYYHHVSVKIGLSTTSPSRTINNVTVKDYQQRHRKGLSTTTPQRAINNVSVLSQCHCKGLPNSGSVKKDHRQRHCTISNVSVKDYQQWHCKGLSTTPLYYQQCLCKGLSTVAL